MEIRENNVLDIMEIKITNRLGELLRAKEKILVVLAKAVADGDKMTLATAALKYRDIQQEEARLLDDIYFKKNRS